MLRMDPTGDLGSFEDCLGGTAVSLPSNDRTVEVTATCEESDRAMPVRDSSLGQARGEVGRRRRLPVRRRLRRHGPVGERLHTRDSSANSCGPWLPGLGSSTSTRRRPPPSALRGQSLVHAGSMAAVDAEPDAVAPLSNVLARRRVRDDRELRGRRSLQWYLAGAYEQADNGLTSVNGVDCGACPRSDTRGTCAPRRSSMQWTTPPDCRYRRLAP